VKPFWKSKTFWVNVVTLVLSLLQDMPEVAGLAAVNLGLRAVTRLPLSK